MFSKNAATEDDTESEGVFAVRLPSTKRKSEERKGPKGQERPKALMSEPNGVAPFILVVQESP